MSTNPDMKIKTLPNNGSPGPINKENSQSSEQKLQCIACRADKKRCTRVTAKDSNLCYWHVDHLKYGIYSETAKPAAKKAGKKTDKKATTGDASTLATVTTATDQVNPDGQQPKPKTRGRKRKQAIDPRFNDTAYITMWPEICEGTCVMVDRNNNVYSYGTVGTVTFLGVKLLTGKIDKTASPRAGF